MITDHEENLPKTIVRIADMASDDKPREKALRNGIRSLSDTELIAILLGGGLPGKSVIDLSREVYNSYNCSLTDMARSSIREMCRRFKGIGPAKAITIAAALELGGRRKDHSTNEKPMITSSADAYNAIRQQLENLPIEEFWIILLSRSNKIIAKECISRGGTVATVVDVKLIMKHAIEHLACGIILAHNHPSDNIKPSGPDDNLTKKIRDAARLMDINVLDHIIVGSSGFYSYADNSRL